jgi:hypothetical protein
MGALDSALSFLTEQTKAVSQFYTDTKALALAGNLGWEDFFKLSAKLSAGTLDRWLGALSMGPAPLAFGTVGANAASYVGQPLTIAPLPANAVPQVSPLIVLSAANAAAAGVPAVNLQPDGDLEIDVNGLANLTAGDAFLVIAYYNVVGGSQQAIAQLILTVV